LSFSLQENSPLVNFPLSLLCFWERHLASKLLGAR
jgi:hypothetical protein